MEQKIRTSPHALSKKKLPSIIHKETLIVYNSPSMCNHKRALLLLNSRETKGDWKCDKKTQNCPVRCWQKCAVTEKGSSEA